MFRVKLTNRKSFFIALTGFKSLFLVKFQASTVDQTHHFLVKLSCESACENLDTISQVFFEETVKYPVWTFRDQISLILGTRFSLSLGAR